MYREYFFRKTFHATAEEYDRESARRTDWMLAIARTESEAEQAAMERQSKSAG